MRSRCNILPWTTFGPHLITNQNVTSLRPQILRRKLSDTMPASTYLAATQLTSQDIRLYYQDDQYLIKESSYDSTNGCYTRKDDVVAVNAKKHTPLAVASWIGKNKVAEVREYSSLCHHSRLLLT